MIEDGFSLNGKKFKKKSLDYIKKNNGTTPREFEENPPEGMTTKEARLAIQYLVDQALVKVDDNLRIQVLDN